MLTMNTNYHTLYTTSTPTTFGTGSFSKASPLPAFQAQVPRAPSPQSDYLHTALEQIDHLANEDVEMQAPLSEFAIYLVVDTNILLHHFEVLAQFVEDLERLTLPVIVIVPGAVVHELDGQKNRDGLAWFARRATAWLLEKIRERRSVKGQAQEETCKSTGNWKIRERGEISTGEMFNDSLILDCCMYFRRGRPTLLCTADNNLCIISQTQSILTITPTRFWSSQQIAQAIYGDTVDVARFGIHKESYRNARDAPKAVPKAVDQYEDDSMMIDDEGPGDGKITFTSEHPINMLHIAVIDHFTRLLVELVGKVGGEEVRQRTTPEQEANMSRHAPRWRHYTEWSASDCLRYLNERRNVKQVNPRLTQVFLLKSYTRDVPGSRPGREWSRQDWRVALNNLKETAVAWGDVSIPESLYFLEPHIDGVFSMPLPAM